MTSSARVPVNVFDNLPVISEFPKGTAITCLASYGTDPNYIVHVGTQEGAVLVYRVTKKQTQSNTDFFESNMDAKRFLSKGQQKKDSIVQLEVLPEAARMVALTSSGVVQVMGVVNGDIEETIATKAKVDKIVTEKASPLCGIACLQKRVVSVFQFRGGGYKLEKEITLKDVPLELEWYRGKLFIGYKTKYAFMYLDSDSPEESDIEELTKGAPLCAVLGDQLLLRMGRQGIFATFSGKKTGKKLDWSAQPLSVGYRKPYAISLQEEQIEVHNCSDEQLVQVLKNTQGLLRLADGPLLLGASNSIVFCLHSKAWDSQIGQLIKAQRIDEAISLFKMSVPASTSNADKDRMMRDIQKAAGVVLFSNLKFSAALPFLKDSDVDVREIITLFPGYLPSGYRYKARHQLESLEWLITETLVKRTAAHSAPPERVKQYEQSAREMVLELFLFRRQKEGPVKARQGTEAYDTRLCLDTACVKFYVDMGSDQLESFLKSPIPVILDDKDIVAYLTDLDDLNALAVYYKACKDDFVRALDLWKELAQREDSKDLAIKQTVDLLATMSDLKTIWKYASWVLAEDVEAASGIFASTQRKDQLPVEQVFGHLSSKGGAYRMAAIRYLEFVVFQLGSNEERYHTWLALAYLDIIIPLLPQSYERDQARPEPGTEPGQLGQFRKALLRLMEHSKTINASNILLRIQETVLYDEQILCYTRLGRHEDALNILFLNLKSHNKATAYCAKFQDEADSNLFLILLKVYLKRVKNGDLPRSVETLLNDYPQYLKPDDVIPLLPPSIKIAQIRGYLESSLRHNQSKLRMGQVEKELRKADLMSKEIERGKITTRALNIESGTRCAVCKSPIGDAMFVWFPNNVVCHFKCKKSDHICPVTGRDFRKDPAKF